MDNRFFLIPVVFGDGAISLVPNSLCPKINVVIELGQVDALAPFAGVLKDVSAQSVEL